MPRTLTATERETFLAEPRVAILAVEADADRPPLTVPVWYHYAPGGDVTFFTGTQGRTARKSRLLERAGRFSLNVQDAELPYRYVTAECAITAVEQLPPSTRRTRSSAGTCRTRWRAGWRRRRPPPTPSCSTAGGLSGG